MSVSAPRDPLLLFLLTDEIWFGGEAHLRAIGEGPVEWLGAKPASAGDPLADPANATFFDDGWILRFGDPEAGEWNLARPIGAPARCRALLPQLPALFDWQLVVPEEHADQFAGDGIQRMSSMIWYADEGTHELPPVHEPSLGSDTAAIAFLHLNQAPDHAFAWDLNLGFVHDRTVIALVRALHCTPHTLEVVVETAPSWRGRGLARCLIGQATRLARRHARRLIYVVAADNVSSIKVADACGLERVGARARLHRAAGSLPG